MSKPVAEILQEWGCKHCGLEDKLQTLATEDCLSVYTQVHERHAIAAPACHEVTGGKGIRLGSYREVQHAAR